MFTFNFFQTSLVNAAANWGPLSEIIVLGSPVLFHTFSIKISDVPGAVIVLLQGVKIAALLNRSTTTNNESYPCDSGKSVMKSIVIVSHGLSGISLGFKGTGLLGAFLVAWQVAQPSIKALTNRDIPGHQNSLLTSS